jgi:ATP-dependent protease ClpP protease subunit
MTTKDNINELHSFGVDVKNREIYLTPVGDSDLDVDNKMASIFIKNIRYLDVISPDPIVIHLNSGGGSWNDGMGIYDAIQTCKSKTTILAYSQVESMSSVILQAADRRIMMPNCYMMLHFGSMDYSGHHLDVQNWAKFEKTHITNYMLDIYTGRAQKGEFFKDKYVGDEIARIKAYFQRKLKEGDWYLTATEALYYGLTDAVMSKRIKLP